MADVVELQIRKDDELATQLLPETTWRVSSIKCDEGDIVTVQMSRATPVFDGGDSNVELLQTVIEKIDAVQKQLDSIPINSHKLSSSYQVHGANM